MTRKLAARLSLFTSFVFFAVILTTSFLKAEGGGFRNAPASAAQTPNPLAGSAQAAAGGKKLYSQNCAQCHGNNLQGMGPAPTLLSGAVKGATAGELFWFITNGDLNKGMPGWPQLPKQQRWQIVSFLQSQNGAK